MRIIMIGSSLVLYILWTWLLLTQIAARIVAPLKLWAAQAAR
jgi:hypothetical protein